MAESRVQVEVSYADAAALQTWLGNLGTDVNAGKVTNFQLSTDGEKVGGRLTLSSSTAISDLTVAVEDE
jgi:hypothetical protein